MSRLRECVDRAWPQMSVTERDRVAVAYFAKGLRDSAAAQLVATFAQGSVGEALRVAANAISNSQIRNSDRRSASSSNTNSNSNNSRARSGRGRYFASKEAEDAQDPEIDPEMRASGAEGAEESDSADEIT